MDFFAVLGAPSAFDVKTEKVELDLEIDTEDGDENNLKGVRSKVD